MMTHHCDGLTLKLHETSYGHQIHGLLDTGEAIKGYEVIAILECEACGHTGHPYALLIDNNRSNLMCMECGHVAQPELEGAIDENWNRYPVGLMPLITGQLVKAFRASKTTLKAAA